MRFDGQVWFDFSSDSVWMFYQFLRELARQGNDVAVEWLPLANEREASAMSAFLGLDDPQDRGRFLHAMLGLVHIEGEDPSLAGTTRRAQASAGIPIQDVHGRHKELDVCSARAVDLGVVSVPALYRHGPAVGIVVNGASLMGDVAGRAALILAMADDDGLWRLEKP
jgi:hypothetical protein